MRPRQRQQPPETTALLEVTLVLARSSLSVVVAMAAARYLQTLLVAVAAVCSRLAVTAHLLPLAVALAAQQTATVHHGLVLAARQMRLVRLRRLVVLQVAAQLVTARLALTVEHPCGVVAVALVARAIQLQTRPTLAALAAAQIHTHLPAAVVARLALIRAALVALAQTEITSMAALAAVAAVLTVQALAVLAATVERPVVAVVAVVQALRPIAARAEMAATDRSW